MRLNTYWPAGLKLFIAAGILGAIALPVAFTVAEPLIWPAVGLLIGAAMGIIFYNAPPPAPSMGDREAREAKLYAQAARTFEKAVPAHPKEGLFSVPVHAVIDVPRVLSDMLKPIFRAPPTDLRKQLILNRAGALDLPLTSLDVPHDLALDQFRGTPKEMVEAFLRKTPLLDLFERQIPIAFSDKTRFEHTFIVAPTGRGKTTLLSHFLQNDFDRVERGECSVIIMDPTRQLFNDVARLKRFAGKDTKLVVLDLDDVKFPLAISLFDFGVENVSERNRAAFTNAATSLIQYVFSSLLKMDLTPHQATALSYALKVLTRIPTANINDLVAILKPGGTADYQHIIRQMRPEVQAYFRDTFDNQKDPAQARKKEVVARLENLLSSDELANMFGARETRIDFFELMNDPHVIFINIPNQLLQEEGVEIFGRFFIAMILLAAERRVDIPEKKRLPCFFYIDECHNVIHSDEKVAALMRGVRKFRVGATFLTQDLSAITPPVLEAIIGNVTTTFVSGVRDPGASRFGRYMNVPAEYITNHPRFHQLLQTEGLPRTVSVYVPESPLLEEPRMTDEEYSELQDLMRERYSQRSPRKVLALPAPKGYEPQTPGDLPRLPPPSGGKRSPQRGSKWMRG